MAQEITFSIDISLKLTKSRIAEILKSKGYTINKENTFVLVEHDDSEESIEIVKFFDDYINDKFLKFIIEQ